MVTMNPYDIFSSHVRDNSPVALVTIIEGPGVGALLVVTPQGIAAGTLGNVEIDRVVSQKDFLAAGGIRLSDRWRSRLGKRA